MLGRRQDGGGDVGFHNQPLLAEGAIANRPTNLRCFNPLLNRFAKPDIHAAGEPCVGGKIELIRICFFTIE
jgi:hypothetical protein